MPRKRVRVMFARVRLVFHAAVSLPGDRWTSKGVRHEGTEDGSGCVDCRGRRDGCSGGGGPSPGARLPGGHVLESGCSAVPAVRREPGRRTCGSGRRGWRRRAGGAWSGRSWSDRSWSRGPRTALTLRELESAAINASACGRSVPRAAKPSNEGYVFGCQPTVDDQRFVDRNGHVYLVIRRREGIVWTSAGHLPDRFLPAGYSRSGNGGDTPETRWRVPSRSGTKQAICCRNYM